MTTSAEKCRRVMEAHARTGRRLDVAFNYRYAPTARRLKELLLSGIIGEIASVDFHWYLDTEHGADYFRRWHAHAESSGSLFVHKATHHFDLLNWFLELEPAEVFARGALRNYGRAGPFRWVRCKNCPHAGICDYHVDIGKSERLDLLYEDPSTEDGYFRDGCVFREEIDIPDTMSAAILYENGVQIAYSLNTFMPIEGYHLAFNGRRGPDRDPAVRAPALADARPRRDPGDGELRADGARHRPARAGRPFRRRRGAAPDAVRAGHGRSRSTSGPTRGPARCRCCAASRRARAYGRTGRCRSPS